MKPELFLDDYKFITQPDGKEFVSGFIFGEDRSCKFVYINIVQRGEGWVESLNNRYLLGNSFNSERSIPIDHEEFVKKALERFKNHPLKG